MKELIEMIIGNIPQNKFIETINELCTIEPSDSEEEVEAKRQKLLALMMMRVKTDLQKEAENDPRLAETIKMAKTAAENAENERNADDFVRNVKEFFKKEE